MKFGNVVFGLVAMASIALASCHEFGHDRPGDYSRRSGRMEQLEGTVTIVDRGHGTFQMGLRDSSKVVFFVVPDTLASAKDRFARLQVGDYVRAEGRHRDGNNFELESLR